MFIRPAVPRDADWLIGELKKFSDFIDGKRPLFGDEAVAREVLKRFFDPPHLLLIAETDDGTRVGFTGGLFSGHLLNPNIRILAEVFWWVVPEHRGGRAGLKLLEAFTDWGKRNADWISFSIQRDTPVNEATLTRRGFKPRELTYLMEV